MEKRIHVKIYGKVHGVFFRANIYELAKKYGIRGFVRNIPNAVEAVFEGEDKAIEEILKFCKIGPPGAVVEKIEVREEKPKNEFSNFEILY